MAALATDQRTKILAKPQIRASEGQQVTVRLGDRVPIPVTNIQVPGSNSFAYTKCYYHDIISADRCWYQHRCNSSCSS